MFVRKIQPWSGGGGGNTVIPPPEDVIISNTLAVTPSGSDTEIELINGFSSLDFANPLQAEEYSNNFCAVATDFTLTAPDGSTDGATVNFRLETAGDDPITMDFADDTILIPDQLLSLFPFTMQPDQVIYVGLQFDDSYSGQWYLASFFSVTT